MKGALLILGRGIGQVMFQNNALSGLLMLVGVLLNSWQMALLAIAGNVVSTLAAYFSGYSREDIRNGLYGFNGTLVGIVRVFGNGLSIDRIRLEDILISGQFKQIEYEI